MRDNSPDGERVRLAANLWGNPVNNETAATIERPQGVLLSVDQLAAMLNCFQRHCYRLADAGKLPRPIRLGALVRWRAEEIAEWIAAGCPTCKGGRQ
jgi:excisionase family DNA binding protein